MSLSFSPLRRRFLDPTRGSVARPNLARTPSRADDRRSLSHHEHEQGEIACTGRVRFPWCETRVAVAALARVSMARLARRAASIAFAANDPDGVRECDSADPSSSSPAAELGEAVARAEAHADALETRMASFPEPPFTAQRLVELLLYPEASGYSTPEKLRVAAEKTLAVTGMTAIAAPEGGITSGALDPAPHARRALDPVSLEQSAFVRALVREAEAEARGDESDGAPAGSSPAADGGSPARRRFRRRRRRRSRGGASGKAGGLAADIAGASPGSSASARNARGRESDRTNLRSRTRWRIASRGSPTSAPSWCRRAREKKKTARDEKATPRPTRRAAGGRRVRVSAEMPRPWKGKRRSTRRSTCKRRCKTKTYRTSNARALFFARERATRKFATV